jgi:hypothetical protein
MSKITGNGQVVSVLGYLQINKFNSHLQEKKETLFQKIQKKNLANSISISDKNDQ